MLGQKYTSYRRALLITGLDSLEKRREKLCLNFAQKAAKHPKFEGMFPLNKKEHTMKMRKSENYKVQNANTERLKTSSAIFMQNLLNKQ